MIHTKILNCLRVNFFDWRNIFDLFKYIELSHRSIIIIVVVGAFNCFRVRTKLC